MAKIQSTETYKPEVIGDLDVLDTYKELMEASVGDGSVYLRAKETLVSVYAESSMTDQMKASIIAQTISTIATQMTAQAMQGAIQIAKENRDGKYILTKLKADTLLTQEQADKAAADNLLVGAQIASMNADEKIKIYTGWKAQAELYRDYGVSTYNLSLTTDIVGQANYTEYGIKNETIKKAQADVYNTYASGYRTNGYVSLVLNQDGSVASGTTADTNGLAHWQSKVAERQYTAFDDNMRQHVVNSSAALVSMLMSTGEAVDTAPFRNLWLASADYLNGTADVDTNPWDLVVV